MLESIKVLIVNLSDCLECSVSVEAGKDEQICYMEQWRTREALDRHLQSPLYGRVMEAMELSRLLPEIAFFESSSIGGLELVKNARVSTFR